MNLQRQKMKPIDMKHLTGGLHIGLCLRNTACIDLLGLSQIEGK
jgi:hypothetical protein